MRTRFIEATQSVERGPNWGKFCVGLFDEEEWGRRQQMDGSTAGGMFSRGALTSRGWSPDGAALVVDLQTGEGAIFTLAGSARADLEKHRVWVCPMFEPFLEWLYGRVSEDAVDWFEHLPAVVEIPDVPFEMAGYRRQGPDSTRRGDPDAHGA